MEIRWISDDADNSAVVLLCCSLESDVTRLRSSQDDL